MNQFVSNIYQECAEKIRDDVSRCIKEAVINETGHSGDDIMEEILEKYFPIYSLNCDYIRNAANSIAKWGVGSEPSERLVNKLKDIIMQEMFPEK